MDALTTYILHFSEASIGDLRLGPRETRRSLWARRRGSGRCSPAVVLVLPVDAPDKTPHLAVSTAG